MSLLADYESYDAMGLAELVRRGEVTPEELLETAIAAVEARNPALNAVVMKMYEEAHACIKAGLPKGPLCGVPFLLKDLGAFYKGSRTTFGCRFFEDFTPDHDSTVVSRYREAGLVVFGKTNTPEFGLTVTTESKLYGPCRNPWDLSRTSGGSSGGAAVAVATGMVPAAQASDGGGSIRIPAACCGLFGFKPTRAHIPSGPDFGEGWNGLSSYHAITRSVRDSALLLDIAAGPSPGDPYCAPAAEGPFLGELEKSPGRLRIAFTTLPPSGVPVDPECEAAVLEACRLCEELGHTVEEARPSVDGDAFQLAMSVIIDANTAAMLDARAEMLGREAGPEDVEYITWRSAKSGREMSAVRLVQAIQAIHHAGREMADFHRNFDVLLSPVLVRPPVPLGFLNTQTEDVKDYVSRLFQFFGFTGLFNATGQPSMSVPLYWSADNLPIGSLFSGRFGEDALLFRLAAQLEKARPWRDRRPELSSTE